MTVDLFFVAGSFVIGVMQIVEARALLQQRGDLGGMVPYSSAVEFLWTLFAVYVLVTGRLDSARWLAIMLLAYSVMASIAAFMLDPQLREGPPPDGFRVPKVGAWISGLFGALYASAAAMFLIR